MSVYITINYISGSSTIESRPSILHAYDLVHAYMLGDITHPHGPIKSIEIEITDSNKKHTLWDTAWLPNPSKING